jgi:hypothetical protein
MVFRWLPVVCAATILGCPGTTSRPCATVKTCNTPCCAAAVVCQDVVCEGVLWGCRLMSSGRYEWIASAAACGAPGSDGGSGGDGAVACPGGCGPHATCAASGCTCDRGFANTDTSWSNGCETLDPACDPYKCGSCPEGYCGPHAECRENSVCRCIGNWLNPKEKELDWSQGCYQESPGCAWNNCNECYTGYCGHYSNCNQNKCSCDTGATHCATGWPEISGCCPNGCSGTSCK